MRKNTFVLVLLCLQAGVSLGQKNITNYHRIDSLIKTESMIEAMVALQELEDNFKRDTIKSAFWVRHSKASDLLFNSTQALKSIDKAILLDKNNSEAYFEKGYLCNKNKDFKNAIDAYSNAIKINPKGKYYYWRAIVYHQLTKIDLAEEDYRLAIEKGYKDEGLYNNYAIIRFEKGFFEEALVFINKAIIIDNKYADAYSARAKIRFCLYDVDSACIDANYAYALGYRNIFAIPENVCNGSTQVKIQMVAEFLAMNKFYKRSIDAYTKLIGTKSDSVNFYVNRGYSYNEIKEFAKAEKDYLVALSMPNAPKKLLYHNLSDLYLDQDKFEKAIEVNTKNIELDSTNHIAYLDRGLCYRKLKWYDKAENEFNKSLSLKPDYHRAFGYRAYLFLELGKYEKAKKDAEMSITINPEYGYGYLVLGEIKQRLGLADFCQDFQNAKKYGNDKADVALREYCK